MHIHFSYDCLRISVISLLKKPLAIVSVINDLVTDNRLQRSCGVLVELGYDVLVIGRRLRHSPPIPKWPYRAERMRLMINTGPLFYVLFQWRLLLKLLSEKPALLFANDLDTLLPNYIVSRMRKVPLVYDSHELFWEVPELENSAVKRGIWRRLESWIVPKLSRCVTVNESIAGIFKSRYGVKFHAVRNIPPLIGGFQPKSRETLGLPTDKKIIILQGNGINIGRGAEELVQSMKHVNSAVLLIIGSGDVWQSLVHLVRENALQEKVILKTRMPAAELRHFTANADLGISIDKGNNPNYINSLPNKLFDYIHAGIPVLCSRLPEIESIVNQYRIGTFIDSHEPEHIAERVTALLNATQLDVYRANTAAAASVLNWQQEKQLLAAVIPLPGSAA